MEKCANFSSPTPLVVPSSPPLRLVGIDWSGAREAGKVIFLADGVLASSSRQQRERILTITRVCNAASLPGGAADRVTAVAAVREHLLRSAPVWVGLDAPVGVSVDLMRKACGRKTPLSSLWRAFVEGYRWRDGDADRFRSWAQSAARGEPKRAADVASKAPFAPTNLRLYRQTHTAMVGLLQPMLLADKLSVIPNSIVAEEADNAMPERKRRRLSAGEQSDLQTTLRPICLLETCPASLLKRIGLYSEPYKGATAKARTARKRILDRICTGGVASTHPEGALIRLALGEECKGASAKQLKRKILDDTGGDALDSVLAAMITALSVSSPALPQPPEGWNDVYRLEGCIYY